MPPKKKKVTFLEELQEVLFSCLSVWPLAADRCVALFSDQPKRVQMINPGNDKFVPNRPNRGDTDSERFAFLDTQHRSSVYKYCKSQPLCTKHTAVGSLQGKR